MALHFGTPGLLEALVASGLPHGAVHVPGTAAATPVASLRDLQVVRKIGAGSFGVVLRVVHARHPEVPFAAKLVTGSEPSKVVRELRVNTLTKHPLIVEFLGSFLCDPEMYLFFELAKHSVHDVLEAKRQQHAVAVTMAGFGAGPAAAAATMTPAGVAAPHAPLPPPPVTPPAVVQHMAASVILGLDYLSTLRILHRDLKPTNVLIGFDGRVKLCDFGVAKEMDSSREPRNLTSAGGGSERYLPPERLLAFQTDDPKADIWSLGISLWEVTYLRFPYQAATDFDMLLTIAQDPPPVAVPVEGFGPDHVLFALFASFVEVCLRKDPNQRPQAQVGSLDGACGPLLEHPYVAHLVAAFSCEHVSPLWAEHCQETLLWAHCAP
eukprot:m.301886 g.301886  ORF g.301886 m.301886 type:complete len:380 (+) comp19570_c0_seq2:166-1305(+)